MLSPASTAGPSSPSSPTSPTSPGGRRRKWACTWAVCVAESEDYDAMAMFTSLIEELQKREQRLLAVASPYSYVEDLALQLGYQWW